MLELRYAAIDPEVILVVVLCDIDRDEIDISDLRGIVDAPFQLRKIGEVVGDSGIATAFYLMIAGCWENVEMLFAPGGCFLLERPSSRRDRRR